MTSPSIQTYIYGVKAILNKAVDGLAYLNYLELLKKYKVQLPNRPTGFKTTTVKLYLQPNPEKPNKEKLTKEPTKELTKELTQELTKKPTKEPTKDLVPNIPYQKLKRT